MKHLAAAFTRDEELGTFLDADDTRLAVIGARSVLVQIYTGICDEPWIHRIIDAVTRRYPAAVIAGATTFGEICGDKTFTGSNVISLSCFDTVLLRPVHLACEYRQERRVAAELASRLRDAGEPIKGVLLLSNTLSVDCSLLLSTLHEHLPGLPLFGGGAGDNGGHERTLIFSRQGILKAGVIAVALCGGTLEVDRRTYLGWAPMGKRMTVTRASDFTIHTIDGRPAFDVYRRYLGVEADEHFFLNAMEFPFLVERHGELIARVPKFAEADGSIRFIADVEEGEQIQFGYAHIETILDRIASTQDAIRAFAPEAIHVYSCCCRHFVMQKDVEMELAPFRNIAPTAGFFTYGEFCDLGSHSPLLNSALLIVSMREGPATNASAAGPEQTARRSTDIYAHHHARILARFQHFTRAITGELEAANERLARLADRDPMTGLYNRRVLESRAEDEILRSVRYGRELCLVMCDIDRFKQLNDTYGHLAGDEVLKEVAALIASEARATDTACRYGGEEFVILLPETPVEAAMAFVERVRSRIETLAVVHESRALPPVTLSFGVSSHPRHAGSAADLISMADQALYEAKRQGRNRIRLADPSGG